MTEIQKGVITLIKSAVTGEKYPLSEDFSIEEAYDFIIRHRVMMLAYDGAVRCGISKNEPAMQKLFQSYISGMLRSEKQLNAVKKIYSAFDKNKIDYLPLKGCNMKFLYPKPELRLMGDADILIREEQYEKIQPVLKEIGFEKGDGIDHHDAWHSDALYLEIHKKPFSISNKEYYEYYGNGWKFAEKAENSRWQFSPENELIHLVTHFAVHCREGGIGIRHAVDFFVYERSHTELNEKYLLSELKKLRLEQFYFNIKSMTDAWFYDKEETDGAKALSDFIFSGGDWGSYKNAYLSSEARKKANSEKTFSKTGSFITTVFLPLSSMRVKYTVLQKQPYLLPFYWVKRWCEIFFKRRKNIARKIKVLSNTDNEKVLEYEEKLRIMGIGF